MCYFIIMLRYHKWNFSTETIKYFELDWTELSIRETEPHTFDVVYRQDLRGERQGGEELLPPWDLRGGSAALQVHPRHQGQCLGRGEGGGGGGGKPPVGR